MYFIGTVKKGEEIYVDYGEEYDWGDIVPTEAPEPEMELLSIEDGEKEEVEVEYNEDVQLEEDSSDEEEDLNSDVEWKKTTKKANIRDTPALRRVAPVFGKQQQQRNVPVWGVGLTNNDMVGVHEQGVVEGVGMEDDVVLVNVEGAVVGGGVQEGVVADGLGVQEGGGKRRKR